MGSSESKIKSNDQKRTQSNPSTPIKGTNSNPVIISHLDPRSPTDDIFRTPIEIPAENNETLSNLRHTLDPRSPTDQFERTPIIIQENQPHPKKLHNKILDNARRNLISSSTISPRTNKDCDSTASALSPPKLISSIPTFKKCNEKRKSFVGLLETNIDFTETNLDDFVKNKSLDKSLTITINELPMCDIVEHKDCDPRSPSKDFLRTPIRVAEKVGEIELNNTVTECETKEVSEIVDCDSTDCLLKLVDENNEENNEKYEVTQNIPEEEMQVLSLPNNEAKLSNENEVSQKDVEVFNENNEASLPEYVSNKIPEIENQGFVDEINTEQKMAEIVEDLIGNISVLTTEDTKIDNLDSKEPIIDLTADVQEFDKKLTKIIHENNENFSFKKIISKDYLNEKSRKRTPMKDRNQISDSRNKLKVSDKPRKLSYESCRIPVFKGKNGLKSKIQCENTPPTDMPIRRKKKSQPRWDSDKTLVI